MGLTKAIEELSKSFENWANRFLNHPEESYAKEVIKMFVMYRLQGLNENITYFPEKELDEIFPVNLPYKTEKPIPHSMERALYSDTTGINIYIGKTVAKEMIRYNRTPTNIPKEIIWLATFVRVKWNKEWKKGMWEDIIDVYPQWRFNAGMTGYSGWTGYQGVTGWTGYAGIAGCNSSGNFSGGNGAAWKGNFSP